MKIYVVYVVGVLGLCVIQNGCGNANSGNQMSANNGIASAGLSPSPKQSFAQNSNATNIDTSTKDGKTVADNEAQTQNGSRKFGQDAIVDLPKMKSKVGNLIVVPVKVTGLAGKDVISYEFDLKYDPGVIQPVDTGADIKGTISNELSLVTNPSKPGVLRVVVYGAKSIDKDGVLLNLKFTAVGKSGSVSPLSIERIMFNEGNPGANANAGQVTLF
ncbi:MAG: hypothetical protein IPL32_13205 [Chloracidobacterium sp.]|nr:hypothetical protein [Chloracidobacterium sp.]